MGIAERRTEIAAKLTAGLAEHEITVDPYRSDSPAPFTGWLQIEQTDREACTYGEVRLTVECQILVATNRPDFERVQDYLTIPLIGAIHDIGGRAVTVQPFRESVGSSTFFSLAARFYTEALISD